MIITYKTLRGAREHEKNYVGYYTSTLEEEIRSGIVLSERLIRQSLLDAVNKSLRAGQPIYDSDPDVNLYQKSADIPIDAFKSSVNWHFCSIVNSSTRLKNLSAENPEFFHNALSIALSFVDKINTPLVIEKSHEIDKQTFELETNNELTNHICNCFGVDQEGAIIETQTQIFGLSPDGTY